MREGGSECKDDVLLYSTGGWMDGLAHGREACWCMQQRPYGGRGLMRLLLAIISRAYV